ncbi:polysaccharide deacetylase family protein [Xanthovirga aplysinae]|uniref:polysaccharide deacetylase family protein n=1 Tax=Xanthovirga aplysinae TaxID=2529853 RepID=UPI0012BC0A22|nr:polysaccharide deacetylase family protein [Xanthovirga aplysinae]MTI33345.1 hypothetical protein [Xanthovirga aplysinae]
MQKTLIFLVLLALLQPALSKGQDKKEVAITMDDLPGAGFSSLEEMEMSNLELIQKIKKIGIPVSGFVNEYKILQEGEINRRLKILKNWAEAELTLGNHTFSHPSFYTTPLEDFKEEVIKGEVFTNYVLNQQGKKVTYFRFPYLSTGPDSTSKANFELFLKRKGYINAPVTIESSDYIFNKLYTSAKKENDTEKMKRVAHAYLQFTSEQFDFFEAATDEIIGRPIKHIFLCHDNELNVDYFEELVEIIEQKNYRIISLEEALKDPVYKQEDTFVGKWGISWIHRWNTKTRMDWLRKEPEPSKEILEEYNNL